MAELVACEIVGGHRNDCFIGMAKFSGRGKWRGYFTSDCDGRDMEVYPSAIWYWGIPELLKRERGDTETPNGRKVRKSFKAFHCCSISEQLPEVAQRARIPDHHWNGCRRDLARRLLPVCEERISAGFLSTRPYQADPIGPRIHGRIDSMRESDEEYQKAEAVPSRNPQRRSSQNRGAACPLQGEEPGNLNAWIRDGNSALEGIFQLSELR